MSCAFMVKYWYCGHSIVVVPLPSKQLRRVRFPLPAQVRITYCVFRENHFTRRRGGAENLHVLGGILTYNSSMPEQERDNAEGGQKGRRKTRTSAFGVSGRESHDARGFYGRKLYGEQEEEVASSLVKTGTEGEVGEWAERIYCQSAEKMPLPDGCVGLAFTSPPYNTGKEYDQDLSLEEYLGLIERVGREVLRVLRPGGRYVINVANLGRKPYIPLHAHFYRVHQALGFLPMGEIIWRKGRGANGSCAWGSWRSARSPRLRDVHEYLLVFAKVDFSRPDAGESDISAEEFMEATLSVWDIPPESARRVGHPAPFPLALAERVVHLYSYQGDVVLDPFAGSGTTCLAAKKLNRRYVGFEIEPDYCRLTEERLKSWLPGEPAPLPSQETQ
jgi:DNA modification methylase